MKYYLLACLTGMLLQSNAQETFQKPGNRILVVSGGGARGAWGVGVVSSFYKTSGGYKAVFGTSTGSLMAAFILLQQFDELDGLSMHLYPNPVKNRYFNFDGRGLKIETYTIRLFDQSGKLILSQELIGGPISTKKISLPGSLPEGMYTVQLADKDGNKVLARPILVN